VKNGFKYGGYKGQLLRVNLSKNAVTKEPCARIGREISSAARILCASALRRDSGKSDPLGPQNKLFFMTGPVNGTMIPAASRSTACAKSR